MTVDELTVDELTVDELTCYRIVILWFKNLEVALKVLKVTETTIRAISK